LARAAVVNVKLLHPDFEYVFYDDAQVEAFIDEHFPDERRTFDSFPVRIQRYDFFRYLAIYHFGGFYLDTDVLLSKCLTPLVDYGCVFPFERLTWSDYLRHEQGMDWEIGNYAFGAAAGHPFLRSVIDNCARAQRDIDWGQAPLRSLPRLLRDELYVIYTTGPGLVSRTLAEYSDSSNPVHVMFPESVADKSSWDLVGDFGVHLCAGGWRVRHGALRRRVLNLQSVRNERRAIRFGAALGKTRPVETRPAVRAVQ
jgi:hypothetical protein